MIKIDTVSGHLITHKEFINTIFFDTGRYYVTLLHEGHFEKWEITSGSYEKLKLMLYGEEKA